MTQGSSTAVVMPRFGRLRRFPYIHQIADACESALNQNRLLFPGQKTRGTHLARVTPPVGSHLLELRAAGGQKIAALFGRAMDAEGSPITGEAPTLLFFYGNEMCLRQALIPVQFLRQLGFNVLVPEYLGYGLSEGRASESGCYATADAAYDYVHARDDINPATIGVLGCSLGGAVAIDLAARRPVSRLATLVTFTSIADMVRLSYPRLPVSWVLRYRFESERKMKRVKCPVLIGHSLQDRRIPYEMADRLAAAAAGPVERLRITGADHSSTELLEIAGEQIGAALTAFFGILPAA